VASVAAFADGDGRVRLNVFMAASYLLWGRQLPCNACRLAISRSRHVRKCTTVSLRLSLERSCFSPLVIGGREQSARHAGSSRTGAPRRLSTKPPRLWQLSWRVTASHRHVTRARSCVGNRDFTTCLSAAGATNYS
jgi:hypothetical protein